MLSRRHFLAAAGATALPATGWAAIGDPALLAAAQEPSGAYALFGLTAAADIAFRIPLPDRGHAAAAHPVRAEAVAFARRPGTFALVIDCADGTVLRRLDAPEGRHFYGHGAFLDGGRVLVTTENAFASGAGRLGLWDAGDGYRRIGDMASGGIGPHEVIRLPGTETLAVANGGIRTHPDTDREKLNLATMRPNLAYIRAGKVVEAVELDPDLHQASIRHLAARADGTVAFAMQWEGPVDRVVPLLGLHRRGGAPRLRAASDVDQAALAGYAGSVAFSGDGHRVAITAPRGGVAHIFDAATDAPPALLRRADVCGVAPLGRGLAFSDGLGGILQDGQGRRHNVLWDNHLVPVA